MLQRQRFLLRGARSEVKLSVNGISGGLNKARLKLRDVLVMEKKVQGSWDVRRDILIQTGNTGEAGGCAGGVVVWE